MSALADTLKSLNDLLRTCGMALCESLEPVRLRGAPTRLYRGIAANRTYAVKICSPDLENPDHQLAVAHIVERRSGASAPSHLCASGPGDNPALWVMDWIDEIPLGGLLDDKDESIPRMIAENLAAALAQVHRTKIQTFEAPLWPSPARVQKEFAAFLTRKIDSLTRNASGSMRAEVERFVGERLDALDAPDAFGVCFGALEMDDVLCARDLARVSAITGWDRLCYGDTAWDVAAALTNLSCLATTEVCECFLKAYRKEHPKWRQTPQAELYILIHALEYEKNLTQHLLKSMGCYFKD